MHRCLIVIVLAAHAVAPAEAGTMGFGRFAGAGLGFGFGRGGIARGGFFGGGPAGESLQTRFEDRFDDLMMDYDSGLMEIDDFFDSDEYDEIVDDLQTLIDRHDFYVERLETSVDRIEDVIAWANDDLLFYEDLLLDYQERDDLSEERLMRIEDRITWTIDSLGLRIESLAEKQADLEEILPSVMTFNEDLSSYLDEILNESMSPADDAADEPLAEVAVFATADPVAASLPLAATTSPPINATLVSVPEPGSTLLIAFPAVVGVLRCRVRRRRRPA